LEIAQPKSLWELYLGFLSIGARSFGGVLPWAHRVLVEERRWVAEADFAELIALCQFLPGPNVGNLSVVLGRRWFGVPGALAAFAGLMALPLVWVFRAGATLRGFFRPIRRCGRS
jgi:chromate transporter